MKKLTTLAIILSLSLFTGCGGGGSNGGDGTTPPPSGGGTTPPPSGGTPPPPPPPSGGSDTNPDGTAKDLFKIVDVNYTLNGSALPICNKPGQMITSRGTGPTSASVHQCTWYCGNYEGATAVTVDLTFVQRNGPDDIWELDSETVLGGAASCHN